MLPGPGRPFRWPRPLDFRPSYFRQIPSAAKHNLVRIPRERSPPLGIGNHVDHQLAFTAAASLARAGWEVWFYEDIPYALRAGARERRLADIARSGGWRLRGKAPAGAHWDARLDAILSYPSQLDTIFRQYVGVDPDRDGISEALAAYGADEHEKTIGERFWSLIDGATYKGS